MKALRLAFACFALCAAASPGGWSEDRTSEAQARGEVSIVPAPAEIVAAQGAFTVTSATAVRFAPDSQAEPIALYFIDLLQRTRGIALPVAATRGARGLRSLDFELRAGEGADDEEGYSLLVSPERIVVSSRGPRGLFYGAVTLWQLLSSHASDAAPIQVPAMTIADAPRFRWRGLMLDSARHYQSPQFIKRFIDAMALHKLNVLHWHLTDDQAWRLEIKKYPKLTSVGAWRVPAGPAAAADIDPATGRPRLYGGFYTQEQVRDIVAHAAARYVTIVPEIEMPGHASAAIAAYPQLGVVDEVKGAVPADWGVYRNLFNVEESTFAFLEDVLGEVLALFPAQYVHVGGDEAVKDQWRSSAQVQSRMRQLGIPNEQALQSYFVRRMEKFLSRHGRRLLGWDEILEGGIAPHATVMSWRGIDGAIAAAAAGHDAVLSPAPTLYFDHRPIDSRHPGRGRVVALEEVYRFDPMPAALSGMQRRHILGVQANVWTEHVRTEERVEYMTFPRAAAVAELGWSPAARLDWTSFSQRLPAQLARYRMLGIGYSGAQVDPSLEPGRRTSHQLSLCSEKLVLSLEDDAPLHGERAIFLVDVMNPCWIYRQADLAQAARIGASVGQVPFNFQIGADVKQIPLRRPSSAAGELEVRIDSCEGERIAVLPLQDAAGNPAVTQLAPVEISKRHDKHDLCFTFTQAKIDPMWAIDSVEFQP